MLSLNPKGIFLAEITPFGVKSLQRWEL